MARKGLGLLKTKDDFFEVKTDNDLLSESISRILLTVPGERVNQPEFGSNLKSFLFELDDALDEEIKVEIASVIQRWEPRVSLQDIILTKNIVEHRLFIKIVAINLLTSQNFEVDITT